MIDLETIILYLFIYIVEALILWWYSSGLFHSRYSKKVEFTGLATGYGCLFLISFTKSFWINTIAFTLVNFIFIIILFNVKWNICIFHSMVTTCIMSLSEIAIIGLSSQFNETVIYINSNITFLIILTVLSKALYFIGLRIIRALIPGSVNENGYTNRATALLNLIPLFSLYIIIILFAILLSTPISTHFRYMLSSCAVLLIFMNILVFYIYHYTQQKAKDFTELQIQLQKEYDMTEYYRTLFDQAEGQQILIHDIRNHLLSIAQLNEQKEQDKISRYLDTLLNSPDLQNSVLVSDNELLNSILCHYMNICREKHIAFKVDVRKNLLQNFNYSDLTALFCNLLDNAVESCSDIPDSYIELSITDKENTDITVISIINTCRTHPSFDKMGLPVSQKKNKRKHGFGLKSVNRIVNKYNGNIKMYFDNDKMAFHTIIAMQCKNESM